MSSLCGGPWNESRSCVAQAVTWPANRPTTARSFAEPIVIDPPLIHSPVFDSLVFVDSNVFLYALDEADPDKQQAARDWRSALWRSRRGRISFQVLGEFYVNVLRMRPAARDDARAEIRDLLAWNPVVSDAALLESGWKIQDRYRFSYWDALIVAAAKRSACRYLLTEDLQPGQALNGIEVVNPFLRTPESVLGVGSK
jgi:predicted nucleic acid-binding protein